MSAERSRRRTFAGDSLWAMGTETTRMAASLGAFFLVTRELGPAQYGLFAGLQAFAAILGTLTGACVAMLLLQESIRERRTLDDVLPMSLGLALGAGLALVPVAAVLGAVLLPGLSVVLVTAYAAGELLGAGAVHVSAAAIQSRLGFSASSHLRSTFHGARLLVVAVLWASGAMSLATLVTVLVAFDAVAGAIALTVASRRLDVPVRLALPRWWELRRGLSYTSTVAAFGVQEDSDKALMVRLAGPLDAGVYAAGYRAVQVATAPIRAMVGAAHNTFLEHDPRARGQHLRRSLRFTGLAGVYGLCATVVLWVAAPAVPTVLGGGYGESVDVVRFVAPLVLLRSLSLFPFNGLMGLGRTGVRTAIVSVSAAVNITASLVLIPTYSWRGAAGATIGSELLFLALTWLALVHHQRQHDRAIDRTDAVGVLVHQGESS